jgi:muramoyltetrapeptide carboxypeptidase LdcA involved in peptidoglycan recycling
LLDPFGALNIPMIADVEFGHVRPRLSIVNGALHRLAFNLDERYLEQSLV